MEPQTVNEQGQVRIPEALRQRMGISVGSRVAFSLVGDHLEMRVVRSREEGPPSGFGLLKSNRSAVPADLDPATLINP